VSELPDSWVETSLGDVTVDSAQRVPAPDEQFQYIDIASIDRLTKRITSPQLLWGRDAPSRARKEIMAGDVLVSMTRPNLNAVALVPAEFERQIASTGFDVLRPIGVEPRWLFYVVRTQAFTDRMSELVQGVLYPAVRSKDVRGYVAPLAPLNEQKCIADKLDAILVRLDACRERLYRVPAILKRFRQAVLAVATSGKLTEQWRAELGRYGEWPTVHLAEVGEFGRGKSKHRPRNDPRLYGGPYPFIQTGDVAQSSGRITTHTQTYSEFGLDQSKLWPAGTVCITIAANIADTAILAYPACFPDSVVGFVADPRKSLPEFIKWSIDVLSDRLEAFAPATAQKNINLAVLNDVEFRCPPIEEQSEIVRRVEALFAYADRLETRYAAARQGRGFDTCATRQGFAR
jgi:type I restriction enzyme S subunit